ncbi:MAG TPA: DUF2007 domain-containing protein [Terriglobales bacterium]|nr:DUF2007 domain-containing protein [Terriglobales bacterium]
MAAPDPQQERQRLIRYYASLSDRELEKLAKDADSLTELAREILEDELDRRDLDEIPEPTLQAQEQPRMRELITIRAFRDLPEALLAKGILDSASIDSFLSNENLVRLDWFISNFVGGIRLQVASEDAEAANALLDQPIPEEFEIEGVGDYKQPRCPKCYSLDISFENLNKPVAYASAYLGVPIPLERKSWKCFTCGRRWVEDDIQTDES